MAAAWQHCWQQYDPLLIAGPPHAALLFFDNIEEQ
jgi:hypothetical protein